MLLLNCRKNKCVDDAVDRFEFNRDRIFQCAHKIVAFDHDVKRRDRITHRLATLYEDAHTINREGDIAVVLSELVANPRDVLKVITSKSMTLQQKWGQLRRIVTLEKNERQQSVLLKELEHMYSHVRCFVSLSLMLREWMETIQIDPLMLFLMLLNEPYS